MPRFANLSNTLETTESREDAGAVCELLGDANQHVGDILAVSAVDREPLAVPDLRAPGLALGEWVGSGNQALGGWLRSLGHTERRGPDAGAISRAGC